MKIMTHNVWCYALHNRRALLRAVYAAHDPDILCLQEITPYIYEQGVIDDLADRYVAVDTTVDGHVNNTPVLYKKGAFDLLESGWHLFDGKNNEESKSLSYAALRCRESGKTVCVGSAHFWYAARSWLDDLCRRYDAEQCLPYVRELTERYDAPMILSGDLNCTIGSPAYLCLTQNGGLDARLAADRYDTRVATWHSAPPLDEATATYGGCPAPTGSHLRALDHMIVFRPERLHAHALTVVTDQTALDSSDHCPMLLEAELL